MHPEDIRLARVYAAQYPKRHCVMELVMVDVLRIHLIHRERVVAFGVE